MCISGIYALNSEIEDVDTKISTSAVEIDLKEYNNNNTEFTDNGKIVMPGEEIALIPKVNNLGENCYLRMKITYTINNNKYNELNYIEGNYKTWNRKEGYYYYQNVFNKKQILELFNKVTIPENLSKEYQRKEVKLTTTVEAVQAKNFDGNWDNVEIKESVERDYDINGNGSSTIIFENNAEKHIYFDKGFFNDLNKLLPGDTKKEKVKILNRENNNTYYLEIKYENLTKEEKNLLRKINLTIKGKNKTITKNLLDFKKQELDTLKGNETDELEFIIHIPIELDNSYSKILTNIIWKFSLRENKKENIIPNPNTWDLKFDLSMIIFSISSLGLLIIIILERNEINNKKKKEIGD